RQTARARDATPFRCLFPITRLSVRAIDAAFARRVAHARRAQRRLLWPNDEALVATTLMNGDFVCRDFNDFGATFYTDASFFFGPPLRSEELKIAEDGVRLVHPVLSGTAYAEKLMKLQRPERPLSWTQQHCRLLVEKVNAVSRW